jgi:hypothetical protein
LDTAFFFEDDFRTIGTLELERKKFSSCFKYDAEVFGEAVLRVRTLVLRLFEIDIREYIRGGAKNAVSDTVLANFASGESVVRDHHGFVRSSMTCIMQNFVDPRLPHLRSSHKKLAVGSTTA